ncbi:ankyrin repeat-containing domain protein [Zopfochytrium polystomum]|nr:ankyrin repeat-containing domain protein [Zopfochytrium polystomum]
MEHGADVNRRDRIGGTALHDAARTGRVAIVKALLERKADTSFATVAGATPFLEACEGGHREVAELLLGKPGGDAVKTADENGRTALHVAAGKGHPELVSWLLGLPGVSVGALTGGESKGTPLHVAAAAGHAEVVRVLLRAGADKDAKAEGGATPLHLAAQQGAAEVVVLLVEHGADVAAGAGENGTTALHRAAEGGYVEVVAALVEKGKAEVDARDLRGETALHRAARGNHAGVMDWLMAHGAEKDPVNAKEQTPFHYAIAFEQMDAIAVLMKHGATGNGLSAAVSFVDADEE